MASFLYAVSCGWLRDLASEATPSDPWPCIRWDEKLLGDQIRFLDVQSELGILYNAVWGLFVSRSWPLSFAVDQRREELLHRFVGAAHERGIRVLSGVGVYSWGFEEVIRQVPEVGEGHPQAMCAFSQAAWDWQRRVLDFLVSDRWNLDGVTLQSADQGRCECPRCSRLSPAAYHATVLLKTAEYLRTCRPDWTIGQASWGLRLDDPKEWEHLYAISQAVDYMIEVREYTAETGRRVELCDFLECAFGSVGGVFVEPPQHWHRLRWFLPCGMGSAWALRRLFKDGGRACEYFYRPFANPVEEVSWRVGARILSQPTTTPEAALSDAVEKVYGVTGVDRETLAEWFIRAEEAYFSRADFQVGWGPLSLEPLVWSENPAAPGPPIYLDRLSPAALEEYKEELLRLRGELLEFPIPKEDAARKTVTCIDNTLKEIASVKSL